MWRSVTLAVVAVLAGCSGLLVSNSTSETPVTPAPVPDTAADVTVTVPRANGSVDMQRVFERHDAALADRSFHRHVVREGPLNTRDVWVDRKRGVVRVRQTFGPLTNDAVLVNGTAYHNVRDDPNTDFESEPSNGTIPYVATLSGDGLLKQFLIADGYQKLKIVERGGRPLAVIAATDTVVLTSPDSADRTVTVESRLYVDQHGVIRYVDSRGRRPDGTIFSVEMTVTTGLDRVPIPWWLEDADPYNSGSM